MTRICIPIKLPEGGEGEVCVPFAYDPYWRWRHEWRERFRDLIEVRGIPEEVSVKLPVLAGLDELAQISEGKLHDQVTRLATDVASEIDEELPEGVHVELTAVPAAAA